MRALSRASAQRGWNPIIYATLNGHWEIVDLLLDKKKQQGVVSEDMAPVRRAVQRAHRTHMHAHARIHTHTVTHTHTHARERTHARTHTHLNSRVVPSSCVALVC